MNNPITVSGIVEEFAEIFWEELGTETDPNGTPNMYLIRNERDEIENGIDFAPELNEMQKKLRTKLTALLGHIEERCEREKNKWKPGRLVINARRSGINDALAIIRSIKGDL